MRRSAFRLAASTALLVLGATLLSGVAGAQEMTAARKFGRGLAGMTTSILEIPGNITQEARTNGALSAATVGLGMGIVKMVMRPIVGAYELVTAPFPAPEGFEPMLAPEFPWSYFDSAPGRVYGFADTYLDVEKAALEEIPGVVVERRRGALSVQFPGDLLFATASSRLNSAAQGRLRDVARVLQDHPETVVEVQGFADVTGRPEANLELAARRAGAVQRYLVGQGVDASRLSVESFGAAAPIATNQTPAGRQANRRVELEIRASGVAAFR